MTSNTNLTLAERIAQIRQEYANIIDNNDLSQLQQKALLTYLLETYTILKQIVLIQNADQTIANQDKDISDLGLLLGLYADLMLDLDLKICQHVDSLGVLVSDVFYKFFDCGYGYISRFGAYSFSNSVKSNRDITNIRLTVSFLKQIGMFIIGSGICYLYFGPYYGEPLPFTESVSWDVVWRSLVVLGIVIGMMFYSYGANLRFLMRLIFPKSITSQYAALVDQKFVETRRLFYNISGSRDEVYALIVDIIDKSSRNELRTQYGTYYSLGDFKNAFISEITPQQRQIIFILLGYKGIRSLLNDAQFLYLTATESLKGAWLLIVSILVGMYFSYIELLTGPFTLPFIGSGLVILRRTVDFLYGLIS